MFLKAVWFSHLRYPGSGQCKRTLYVPRSPKVESLAPAGEMDLYDRPLASDTQFRNRLLILVVRIGGNWCHGCLKPVLGIRGKYPLPPFEEGLGDLSDPIAGAVHRRRAWQGRDVVREDTGLVTAPGKLHSYNASGSTLISWG